jgi:hypothetical protein
MEDANATQMEADLAILQRLREKNPEKLSYYKETAQAFEFEDQAGQQVEEYKKAGGDAGAIKEDLSALVPPAVGYSVASPVATAVTPTVSVAPTVTPAQVLPNALNAGKNLLRATPASIMGGEALTALATGRYEKDKDVNGYDFQKHGMYLEFPGVDVGRIPYYFNRSMYDLGSGIASMFSSGEPKEEKEGPKEKMPETKQLLQSGIY